MGTMTTSMMWACWRQMRVFMFVMMAFTFMFTMFISFKTQNIEFGDTHLFYGETVFLLGTLINFGIIFLYMNIENGDIVGFPHRLYLLPLRSWKLSLLYMSPYLCLLVVLQLFLSVCLNYFCIFPWIGMWQLPFLVFIVTSFVQAVNLSLGKSKLICALICLVIVFIFTKCMVNMLYFTVGWGLCIPLSYGIIVYAMSRDRRGDAWTFQSVIAFFEKIVEKQTKQQRIFVSIRTAQLWFEFTEKGWTVPLLALLMVVISLGLCASNVIDGHDAMMLFMVVPTASMVILSYLCGFLSGCINGRGASTCSVFRAIKPVKDVTLSRYLYLSALLSTLITIVILVSGFVLAYIYYHIIRQDHVFRLDRMQLKFGLIIVLALPSIIGIGLSNGLLIQVNGFKVVFNVLFYIPIVLLLCCGLLGRSEQTVMHCLGVLLCGYLLGAVIMVIYAFKMALRYAVLSKWAVYVATVIFISVLGYYFVTFESVHEFTKPPAHARQSAGLVLSLNLIVMSVAPIAMVPLSLFINRHGLQFKHLHLK